MAELKRIAFEVLVNPIPLARPRFSRGRSVYLPKRSREYRQILQQAASVAMAKSEPLTGELFCRLNFYRKFKLNCRNFGDIDNHIKAILDALNGICYKDDSQIVTVTASKHTDKEPRVAIEIGCVDLEKEKGFCEI